MIDILKETIMEIKDLRDSDNHQCPEHLRQICEDEGINPIIEIEGDCSCGGYDLVIDKLQSILGEIDSDSPTPEEGIYLKNEIKKMEMQND